MEKEPRSPEFAEWEKELRNQPSRKEPTPQHARDTPTRAELRQLELHTKLVADPALMKSVREGVAKVVAEKTGIEVDTMDDLDRIVEMLAHPARSRTGVAAPVQQTPETGRQSIEKEIQDTQRMPAKSGASVPARPSQHADPAILKVSTDYQQAPCTFSSTKSDCSVGANTKKPKPRWGRTEIPKDLVRQLPGKKPTSVIASASSAFSHPRSDGSINASEDYGMARAPTVPSDP
eukprot:CAMPEP_0174850762 /NCGR_PEP_ID=MMETSP1114-20130205/21128_1 /TAXON_ID=312471 /ORGANISM="Neobodo designis, Strain CCAP 1951/1" /LENGTH=233 /DNA_ID=CAMNT_0016085249 /DNA_START=31 /DNA_END=732 /DNA_ORIENTATION=-